MIEVADIGKKARKEDGNAEEEVFIFKAVVGNDQP